MATSTKHIAHLFLLISMASHASPEDYSFDGRHVLNFPPRGYLEKYAEFFLRMPPTVLPTTTELDPDHITICRCNNHTRPVCGILGGKLKTHKNRNCLYKCSPKSRVLHSGACRVYKSKVNKVDTEYMNAYKPTEENIV
ncbi:hypothetical protein O0L34_g121 [Tuta absoluta]|nr:hypothetical protein O0L34_g121 [Tuta absoluta]